MGCDGGTIPKRHELIRVKAKEEVKDSYSQTITKWFYCQLSNSLLEEPIVSDQLGRLYNKEFIVRKLLEKVDKSELNDIYTIKQLTNLNLTKCLNENDDTKDAIQDDIKQFKFLPRFMCPITRKEMNGKNTFCYLSTCGCVFSELALKQVPSTHCLSCNKEFTSEDVIPINPNSEQLVKLEDRRIKMNEIFDKEINEKKLKRKIKNEGNGKKKKSKKEEVKEESSKCNVKIPELKFDKQKLEKEQSAAIKSLYEKKAGKEKGNWISNGTFNRYSAY